MGENKTLTYNNNISIQLVDNSFENFKLIISKDNDDKYIKDLFAIDDVAAFAVVLVCLSRFLLSLVRTFRKKFVPRCMS